MNRRLRQPIGWAIALVAISGLLIDCSRQHDNADFLPTSPIVQGALSILLSATELTGDGVSTVLITARIDPESDSRKVVFETTLGQFLDADSNDSSKRTRTVDAADLNGEAIARLRSDPDRTLGSATVTVSIKGPVDPAQPGGAEETKISRTIAITIVAISPDTIEFTISGESLPADGFSVLELLAHVDPALAQAYRSIRFRATPPGMVVGGAASDGVSSRTVTADSEGNAGAQLTSDKMNPGIGRSEVTAQLANFPEVFRTLNVDFQPLSADTLELTASATSIPADGFSTVELLAVIDPATPPDFRNIIFETTRGTFVGIGTVSGDTITVTADANGEARASLRSDREIGPVEVRAALASDSSVFRTLFLEFTAPAPGSVIQLEVSSASAPADGGSQVRITAIVAPEVTSKSPRPTVNFTTSLGTFTETNSKSAANRTINGDRASVTLKTETTIGTAFLTAEVDGFVAEATVDFRRSFPDFIEVDAGAFELDKSASLGGRTITVTLRRDAGRGEVSEGTVVEYSIVKESDGTPIGDIVFRNIRVSTKSGPVQQSTADLVTDSSAFTGLAIVRATVPGSGAAAGEDTISIVP